MSHDQIEAVLMRRGGYAVRVLAEEGASFEQNPPTLVEFIRRDLRWCQGNMQYWHFLTLPGLKPVSRYQLAFAILMFLGSPAWIGMLLIGSTAVALAPTWSDFIRGDAGLAIFLAVLVMWFAPKIATVIDVLSRPDLRRVFGGGLRFTAGVLSEVIFFLLLAPIMWASHTLFLASLLLGRTIGWGAQARDDHEVPWSLAVRQFWPQTLIGLWPVALLAVTVPWALPYALFIAGGPLLSIPLAVVTASPAMGRALMRLGLGRLPEETAPPAELRALALPAIEMSAPSLRPAP
jgi:membrane glycosyltransferase